ncbi:MAG: histidinol-phosphate transaminase [Ktedonobacteraceae bacterium]
MENKANIAPELSARAVHGALDFGELARLKLQPDEILDFSVNSNPYGPSPHVREAISTAVLDRYPDRECLQLRQAILQHELAETNLPLAAIVCGNGTSELIWTVARTFLEPGAKVAIIGPTFGEYRAASQVVGSLVSEIQAQPASDFRHTLSTLLAWLQAEKPRLTWLCNPNNPTGTSLSPHEILLIAETCRAMDTVLVVDESYKHFVWPRETFSAVELLKAAPGETVAGAPVIILRSLTKDFALAGVRLGYAVASPEVIERLSAQLPAWNVSGLAQAAGIAAVADREHLARTLAMLEQERQAFFVALQQTGRYIVPSRTHFCLVEVGNARLVRQRLLMQRILVRDGTSFGLPQYIRVATRPAHEWSRLLALLPEVLQGL